MKKKSANKTETSDAPVIYTTLSHHAEIEFVERKSVFYGNAAPVKTPEEAVEFVNSIRSKYPDATHNVYAYLIGANVTRFSDDGEPSGTAGMPVLDVIRKTGFTDAAIVVTRYFGGILLGAGGLVRAYSTTAKLAAEAAGIVSFEPFTTFCLRVNYSDYQRIDPILQRYDVRRDNSDFSNEVCLNLAIKKPQFEPLRDTLIESTAARALIDITGERFDS
ncbi:MAG: YigZ family protein [Clostridia bacterium]|nr:YigZ family protein [Clostridia bacterium]